MTASSIMRIVRDQDHEWTYAATCLASPGHLDTARIDPAAIEHAELRNLVQLMQALRAQGKRIGVAALKLAAQRAGFELDATVDKLAAHPIERDLGEIRNRVVELAKSRRIVRLANELAECAERGDTEAQADIIARLTLSHDAASEQAPVLTFNEMMSRTVEEFVAVRSNSSKMVSVGMPTVDKHYRLSPGQLMTVGAATNVGKSTLLIAWLESMASRGIPCGLISVEDGAEDIGAKVLGQVARKNPSDWWREGMSAAEFERVRSYLDRAKDCPMSVCYVPSRGIDEVIARMEFMARVRGCRVVMVDYLQAISHRAGRDIRERIDRTLEELISTAGRLGVALVLASQMSRPDKQKPFSEPNMIDLKESGSIENRSQCIVLLWRDSDRSDAKLSAKIAKAKRTAAGARFELIRHPQTGMLVEKSEHEDEPW